MKKPELYRTIKVPQWVHENCKQAEVVLQRKGLEILPKEILEPTNCPICHSEMNDFIAKYEYMRIPVKSTTYSEIYWPPIPELIDHLFRNLLATHSGVYRPPNRREATLPPSINN